MAWVLDLDGVVWLADRPIEGAADAIAELRRRGEAVAFVTNNSAVTRADVEDKLRRFGIEPGDGVVTSAMAAATLVTPGETVLVCGGPGIEAELRARQVEVVRDGDADAVLVGFHRDFDYERMRIASTAVRNGARLIATNDDATYPTPDGPIPGGGSILASVATASGVTPDRRGQALRADGGAGATTGREPRASGSATGPTPTAASLGRSGSSGRWSCRVSRGARTSPSIRTPTWSRADLAALVASRPPS